MKIITVLALACSLSAQDANPLSREVKLVYNNVKKNILESAEKMPEENYSFKPAPRVRTFGQLLGHLAEEQYIFCGAARGEKRGADVEKSKTGKAEIIAALQEAFAYCDVAYDNLTDATAVEKVKIGSTEMTRLRPLWGNIVHNSSHYGNMVTYMRIKGLVPPSTEGQ